MEKIDTSIQLNSGYDMPLLGLGVWQATDREAEEAVTFAMRTGYRMFDTAEVYDNERGVGRAIRNSGVPRDSLFVTTKYWPNGGYDAVRRAFNTSYARLGLEYIDLFLIHWPPAPREAFLEIWHAFEELLKDGRLRSIGVSNFAIQHLEALRQAGRIMPAVNQVELHPDFQQRKLVDYCQKAGIAVESWSPLGGASRGSGNLLENKTISQIAQKHVKTPAQVIIRWHLQTGHIVIPKSVHPERIRENAEVFDFSLDRSDLNAINRLDSPSNRVGPDPAEVVV